MKSQFCVLAALFAAGGAIISQPLRCSHPDLCAPRVLTTCPRKDPIPECLTCCCNTSENVEFYNPDRPEPWCTASPAVYTVKFVGTWSRVCNPDYYPSTAHWSPPTGASHNTNYQMWDACMVNVSAGVAQVSQIGATRLIEQEYEAAGDNILNTFKADRIDGPGETSRDLSVDKTHQWVSTVTMLAPSLDRMVGVAGLRLCNGHDWRRSVKVCSELFSTATRSERFHDPMQRNSIQWNNCSFGYFEFTFKEYKDKPQTPLKKQDLDQRVCPKDDGFQDKCGSCCCKSSDNVEFYHFGDPPAVCGATSDATYKFSFRPISSPVCHPGFTVNPIYFTDPLVTSHTASKSFDKRGVHILSFMLYITGLNASFEVLSRAIIRQAIAIGDVHDYYSRGRLGTQRVHSGPIKVAPAHSYIAFASKLVQTLNQFVGFDGLNLCGEKGWEERVEVCLELLAAVNKTETPDAEVVIQANQCSFGSVVFERLPIKRNDDALKPRTSSSCVPLNEIGLTASADCCYSEFILEGRIIRIYKQQNDADYSHTLLVKVTDVFYDEIDKIMVGDVVEIKVCSLNRRIKRKNIFHLAGTRECGSNELEISGTGVLADRAMGESPCVRYIRAGNCDDPR